MICLTGNGFWKRNVESKEVTKITLQTKHSVVATSGSQTLANDSFIINYEITR